MDYDFRRLSDVVASGGRVLVTPESPQHMRVFLDEGRRHAAEAAASGVDVHVVAFQVDERPVLSGAWNASGVNVLNLNDFAGACGVPPAENPLFDLSEMVMRIERGGGTRRMLHLPHLDEYDRLSGVVPFMSVLRTLSGKLFAKSLTGSGLTVVATSASSETVQWAEFDVVFTAGDSGLEQERSGRMRLFRR